jgi:hypothetical protein
MNEWHIYSKKYFSQMAQFCFQFITIFSLIYLTKLLIAGSIHQQCILENQQEKKKGDFWIHQNFFNVTCLNGKIEAKKHIEKKRN